MSFYIQSVEIGGPRPFYLLGPCSLECESFVWEMARSIKAIAENLDVPLIFKASYDKANRTSVTSFRGPGVREGCRILSEIGRELKLPVVTDVHTAQEAEIAAEYVDLLQVPAFFVPPDGSSGSLRQERPAREYQKRAVPGSVGYREHRGKKCAPSAVTNS